VSSTPAAPTEPVLVLITGTGRSGTSTMAGTLHHLGLAVPGPHLGANDSNPRGFFESRWATRFHKRITAAAGIHDMDSRPTAFARAQAAVPPAARDQLTAFLRKHAGEPQLVVKDPRSVSVQDLWRECAADAGFGIRYLSMLRQPAEVVGSRSTYYADRSDAAGQRRYEIFNVARWINSSLINERETRGQVRSFVRYDDLLTDWRSAVLRMGDELGLTFADDLTDRTHHPVDDFIDPGLRRVRVTWDDLDVPSWLREVADGVWDAHLELWAAGGTSEDASARLDGLAQRYRRLFEDAEAVSHDALEEAVSEARLAGSAEARPAPAPTDGPRVADVGGRELLAEAGRRLTTRLTRRRGRDA
jgi:hypothetical protein